MNARVVDVPKQESVHGAVPVAGILVPGDRVPPISIESAVGEIGEFGENVKLCITRDWSVMLTVIKLY